MIAAGQYIAQRFEIEREVGSGGMATIYLARDRETGAPVALKVIRSRANDREMQHVARFDREVAVLAELRHPAVVRYVAHGMTDAGEPFLAMEWLDGEDLQAVLARRRLSIHESVELARRVAEALAAVHARGLVHRDIKPGNLFLVGGRVNDLKLIDFGLARRDYSSTGLTGAGVVVGTPGYMAPEQARGKREIDARADLFSLGCVLYKCLTGRAPFEGEQLIAVLAKVLLEETPQVSALRPDVPPALDELTRRMLHKDPTMRPVSAAQVVAEISAIPLGDRADENEPLNPASAPFSSGLTASEQRVMTMLLIGGDPEASSVRLPLASSTADSDTQSSSDLQIRALVREHGGHADRLADGARIVTFAGGAVATDLSARAARCALALRAALPGLPIALVTIRSELSRGLPVGDAIDRAVKMLAQSVQSDTTATIPGGAQAAIAIDEVAAGLLDGRFDVRALGVGFELRGARNPASGTRTLLGRPTRCVGRDWELSSLERLLVEVVEDRVARAVLVTAAAGMGKSRLSQELVSAARQSQPNMEVWIGRGDSLRAGSALGLLGGLLRGVCGIQEGEPLSARQEKIRKRVLRHMGDRPARDTSRVAEFLGELMGAPFDDDHRMSLRAARQDARLMSEQLRIAWEDFIDVETAAHPVLIVLDDLHWGDLPTTRFIGAALRNLQQRPLMVLAVARPEVHDLFPCLWAENKVQEIRLSPLSRKAGERLVREVLGDGVDDETVARIVVQADGNAFFLEELIRATAEAELRGEVVDASKMPETVLAMVQARLEGLEGDARRLLRAASVFGDVFWPGGVEMLLGGGPDALSVGPWIQELVQRELISRRPASRIAGEPELVFRHALVREGAYGMLTERDRELGHRLAASWLEQHGENDPMLLAQHFERAKEPALAVSAYLCAAEQALRGDDLDAALARTARGISCGAAGEELGKLLLVDAEAYFRKGQLDLAEERALEASTRFTPGSTWWFQAHTQVVHVAGWRDSCDELESWVEVMLAVVPAPDAAQASLLHLCACAKELARGGRYAFTDALMAAIDQAAEAMPVLEPMVVAAIRRVQIYRFIPEDLVSALAAAEAVIAAFEDAGDRASACYVRGNYGFILGQMGDLQRAEKWLRETAEGAQKMGLQSVLATAHLNLGLVVALLGRTEEGLQIGQQALDAFRQQGTPTYVSFARVYVARIRLLAGDLDAARRDTEAIVDDPATPSRARGVALAVQALAHVALGNPDAALAAGVEAGMLLAMAKTFEEGDELVRVAHAEALRAAGRWAEFAAVINAARDALLARAARLGDPAQRERFLQEMPEHARTLELAAEADRARAEAPRA